MEDGQIIDNGTVRPPPGESGKPGMGNNGTFIYSPQQDRWIGSTQGIKKFFDNGDGDKVRYTDLINGRPNIEEIRKLFPDARIAGYTNEHTTIGSWRYREPGILGMKP
jgi:hypothetical protein